jgi:hypothetical protein
MWLLLISLCASGKKMPQLNGIYSLGVALGVTYRLVNMAPSENPIIPSKRPLTEIQMPRLRNTCTKVAGLGES